MYIYYIEGGGGQTAPVVATQWTGGKPRFSNTEKLKGQIKVTMPGTTLTA